MADIDYDKLNTNDVIPIEPELSEALHMYVPHLAHVTHVRVVTTRRAIVVSVEDEVVIKYGYSNAVNEAENLRYVSAHTSLPVPKFFGLYVTSNSSYLVVEFIKGKPAIDMWPSLSYEQKQRFTDRLQNCMEELRALSASYIGSAGRNPLASYRLREPDTGPFSNEEELHGAIVMSRTIEQNSYIPLIQEMLKRMRAYKFVFSHGDLLLKNLMIHEGELSAIIDWEYAGFYPEYWEYANSSIVRHWAKPELADWNECFQTCLKPFPVEAGLFHFMSSFSPLGL